MLEVLKALSWGERAGTQELRAKKKKKKRYERERKNKRPCVRGDKEGCDANDASDWERCCLGCGEDAGERLKRRKKSVWYRQLWRCKMAAMIDERLKFNQNGAWSIFREVNRLISQALLPPPHLFPLHMTTSDTGTPFVYFPSAPRPSPFLPLRTPLIPYHSSRLCNQSGE